MKRTWTWITVLTATMALTAGAGCDASSTPESEADTVAAALELDNGGLTMEDEAPLFGADPVLLESLDAEIENADPVLEDPTTAALMAAPDAAVMHAALLWGQIPGNPDFEAPRDWSGALHVNRGAIIVRRLIRFEDATDGLLPRPDPATVAFTSVTGPHHDGMVLTIVDPTPGAPEPQMLTYGTPGGMVYAVPVAALAGELETSVVDEYGNRIIVAAVRRPVALCEHGFLRGRWHGLREGVGVFMGRVTGPEGGELGHVRGLYGVRESGERVFFGKYIDEGGAFRGILTGHYADGRFAGRWIVADGTDAELDRGVLNGLYAETLAGEEVGGLFIGRWAETTCELPEIAPEL